MQDEEPNRPAERNQDPMSAGRGPAAHGISLNLKRCMPVLV